MDPRYCTKTWHIMSLRHIMNRKSDDQEIPCLHQYADISSYTLPETNSSPLNLGPSQKNISSAPTINVQGRKCQFEGGCTMHKASLRCCEVQNPPLSFAPPATCWMFALCSSQGSFGRPHPLPNYQEAIQKKRLQFESHGGCHVQNVSLLYGHGVFFWSMV